VALDHPVVEKGGKTGMALPSFVFSGLDRETLSLSSELAALGGGNAVVKSMELHVLTRLPDHSLTYFLTDSLIH